MWMRKDRQLSSQRPARLPGHSLVLSLAILAATVLMSFAAPQGAQAGSNVAARVNATIRPCFGVLLEPELRTCRSQQQRRYIPGDWGTRFPRGSVAHFDCREGPYALDRILERLPSGSTLYLRGTYGWRTSNGLGASDLPEAYAGYSVCEVNFYLRKSIIIQPETGPGYDEHPLVLKAPQGESCITIAPTADQVIVRNLTLMSTRGANQSCIMASGGEFTLENANVRYDGERSAVAIQAGRFNMSDTNLIARTEEAALEINHAALYVYNSRIASTYNGIRGDITNDSRLSGVTVLQLSDWQGFERGENARAIDLNLETNRSILTIDQIKTLFYGNGLYLDGAGEALVSNSLFYSDHAINSNLERIRILNNYIFADEVGISLDRGTAYVGDNHIRLVRTAAILTKPEARLRAVNNHIETERCQDLSWGDVAPEFRNCTPWHKQAAFGIPGGGVDWSIYDVLSEACGSGAPSDGHAGAICDKFRGASFKTLNHARTYDGRTYSQLIKAGCSKNMQQNTAASYKECKAYQDLNLPESNTMNADVEEASYRSLKAICTQTPADGVWGERCETFRRDSDADVADGRAYEDDDTNLPLADGKEWLSAELYSNENNLYSVNAGTFMPIFDNYFPRPPYRMASSALAAPNSPDKPESGFGAPPPRNPSPRKDAPDVPAPVPPIPRIN
jgi:hypothetical protein